MPEKKNQHYVPQMYLRNFSEDKKTLNLVHRDTCKAIENASVAEQCSKNYFYGRDSSLDEFVSLFEGSMKYLLDAIVKQRTLPTVGTNDHIMLLMFVLVMQARTLAAKQQQLAREKAVLKAVDERGLDKPMVEHIPHNAQLFVASLMYPAILDLTMAILVNETNQEFITSDNPVVSYNHWLTGMAADPFIGVSHKGLMICMPVDTRHKLLLYDPKIYKLIGLTDGKVIITDKRNVTELNTMQIHNCHKCVYFVSNGDSVVSSVQRESKHKRSDPVVNLTLGKGTDDWRSEVIFDGLPRRLNFDFCKLNKRAKNSKLIHMMLHPSNQVETARNARVVQEQMVFAEMVRQERIHPITHSEQPEGR
jgi:hypothetical protein